MQSSKRLGPESAKAILSNYARPSSLCPSKGARSYKERTETLFSKQLASEAY